MSGVKLVQTDLSNSLELVLLFPLGRSVIYEMYDLYDILSSAACIFKGENLFGNKKRKCTIKYYMFLGTLKMKPALKEVGSLE